MRNLDGHFDHCYLSSNYMRRDRLREQHTQAPLRAVVNFEKHAKRCGSGQDLESMLKAVLEASRDGEQCGERAGEGAGAASQP